MTIRIPTILALLAPLLTACAGPPPPPPPTTVALTLTGAPDMNGGLPAQAKVYYLRSVARFETADFFALFNAPEATLGDDLVSVDAYQLSPGKTVVDAARFEAAAIPAAIGIVAAFRDIGRPGWSATAPLTPGAANPVHARVSDHAVALGR